MPGVRLSLKPVKLCQLSKTLCCFVINETGTEFRWLLLGLSFCFLFRRDILFPSNLCSFYLLSWDLGDGLVRCLCLVIMRTWVQSPRIHVKDLSIETSKISHLVRCFSHIKTESPSLIRKTPMIERERQQVFRYSPYAHSSVYLSYAVQNKCLKTCLMWWPVPTIPGLGSWKQVEFWSSLVSQPNASLWPTCQGDNVFQNKLSGIAGQRIHTHSYTYRHPFKHIDYIWKIHYFRGTWDMEKSSNSTKWFPFVLHRTSTVTTFLEIINMLTTPRRWSCSTFLR